MHCDHSNLGPQIFLVPPPTRQSTTINGEDKGGGLLAPSKLPACSMYKGHITRASFVAAFISRLAIHTHTQHRPRVATHKTHPQLVLVRKLHPRKMSHVVRVRVRGQCSPTVGSLRRPVIQKWLEGSSRCAPSPTEHSSHS